MSYKQTFFLLLFSLFLSILNCQTKIEVATLSKDGIVKISKHVGGHQLNSRSNFKQLDNFPFTALAHPNFNNFRNVSIADLNNDGYSEIIVCLNETLFALKYDGSILWSTNISGTANFPPAIADIDNDGDLEIAIQTYTVPMDGNVYLLDHEGNIQDGWPFNNGNNFFLNGITLADIDGNGTKEIIASERISSSSGRLYAFNKNGQNEIANWPLEIPGTPAFTPSIGDINNDGKIDIITSTTTELYAFNSNGTLISGFPFEESGAKFSYQSPILADLNQDENIEIIGARHNDLAGTYVLNSDGSNYGEWPDYDDLWTFATPSVADINGDGDLETFFMRPYFSETEIGDIILGYDRNGNMLDNFPIEGSAGGEGIIAIADIDDDGDFDLITSSKIVIEGMGLIQAYDIGSGELLPEFPLKMEGFTFLNGAYLADVDNDGLLDLTALSRQMKFNSSSPDSAFINVFNLEVPYNEERILFNGYKGSLDHTGYIQKLISNTAEISKNKIIRISPNPASEDLFLSDAEKFQGQRFQIYDVNGKLMSANIFNQKSIDISELTIGNYFIFIELEDVKFTGKFLKN